MANSLWIAVTCPKGTQVVLRPAYAPNDQLQLGKIEKNETSITIHLSASIGRYRVKLEFPDMKKPMIRYTTTFKASAPLLVPFWPRDMVVTGPDDTDRDPKGSIHVSQVGTRSSLQYLSFDQPADGALLYFQNLTALNDYAQATETSLGNVVGGSWPELGLALPPTLKEKPIPAHQEIVLSDAFLAFSSEKPKDDMAQAKQFLNLLGYIYLHLPKPATTYYS